MEVLESKIKEQISLEQKKLEGLKAKKQNIENNINYITELQAFIILIPKLLQEKIFSCIKYSTAVTLLFSFLITVIIACMGYTTEAGFRINEIMTALFTSASISATTMAGVSIWTYQRDKKDLNSYRAIDIEQEFEEAQLELDDIIRQIDDKEKELRAIESTIPVLEHKTATISTQSIELETKKEMDDVQNNEDRSKVKRFKLN